MHLLGIVLLLILVAALVVSILIEAEDNKTASKPPMGPHPWASSESMPETSEKASDSTSTCKDRT